MPFYTNLKLLRNIVFNNKIIKKMVLNLKALRSQTKWSYMRNCPMVL